MNSASTLSALVGALALMKKVKKRKKVRRVMKMIKESLSSRGFDVGECHTAMLKDKLNTRFFIFAKDKKTLTRLIKKSIKRGAVLISVLEK